MLRSRTPAAFLIKTLTLKSPYWIIQIDPPVQKVSWRSGLLCYVMLCIGLSACVRPCGLVNRQTIEWIGTAGVNVYICLKKWEWTHQHPWKILTHSEKRHADSGENKEELYGHEQGKQEERGELGRELCIVCVWLDAMGQRLSHAFMNAYFKQSPSWANLYCSPEWGCWLKANYMLQIWPLVKSLLIWHGLDTGLGACLWASAPDSHARVSTNLSGTRRQDAWWMLWGLCL